MSYTCSPLLRYSQRLCANWKGFIFFTSYPPQTIQFPEIGCLVWHPCKNWGLLIRQCSRKTPLCVFCLKHCSPVDLVPALLALALFRGRHYFDKWNATNPQWAWLGLKGQGLHCAGVCTDGRVCVEAVSAADNNKKFRSIPLVSRGYVNVRIKVISLSLCITFLFFMKSCCLKSSLCFIRQMWRKKSPLFSCAQSVPAFHQHIISSLTVGSKASCLEVHIQSCRLKQIAICIPLGGEKKQREAPFLIPSLHLAEYSLFEPPYLCFFPLLLWPSEQNTVRAITAISVSSCRADWEVAAKTKEWVSSHYGGVWFGGVSKWLLRPSV